MVEQGLEQSDQEAGWWRFPYESWSAPPHPAENEASLSATPSLANSAAPTMPTGQLSYGKRHQPASAGEGTVASITPETFP